MVSHASGSSSLDGQEGDRGSYGHHHPGAQFPEPAGAHPVRLHVIRISADRRRGPWRQGMTAGQPPAVGLMANARTHNHPNGARHKDRGTHPQAAQAGAAQADAAPSRRGEHPIAPPLQQWSMERPDSCLPAVDRHNAVFTDGPRQQKAGHAQPGQIQLGHQLLPWKLGPLLPGGHKRHGSPLEQSVEHGRAAAFRVVSGAQGHGQAVVAAAAVQADASQLSPLHPHRRVAGTRTNGEAGLGADAATACRQNIRPGKRLLQAHGGHVGAELAAGAHPQITSRLPLLQLLHGAPW